MNSRNKNLEIVIYNKIKRAWPEIKEMYHTTECRLPPKKIEFQNENDKKLSPTEINQGEKPPPLRESKLLKQNKVHNVLPYTLPTYSSVSSGVYH